MTGEQRQASPLGGWRVARSDRIGMAEIPFLGMVALRMDPAGPAAPGVAGVLGVAPPTAPNTVAGSPGGRQVLWLGPDEWLVVDPAAGGSKDHGSAERRPAGGPAGGGPAERGPAELVSRLPVVLNGHRGSAVDVSAHRTTVELTGRHSRDVVEHGCSLDLHPRVFGPGRCAQTLLAKAPVILWRTVDTAELGGPAWRILVRASFAAYLRGWLLDAAVEYR